MDEHMALPDRKQQTDNKQKITTRQKTKIAADRSRKMQQAVNENTIQKTENAGDRKQKIPYRK